MLFRAVMFSMDKETIQRLNRITKAVKQGKKENRSLALRLMCQHFEVPANLAVLKGMSRLVNEASTNGKEEARSKRPVPVRNLERGRKTKTKPSKRGK